MSQYQELKAWQEARILCRMIYVAMKQLPAEEMYALSSQMRRAAVSVASNIAEGAGRGNQKEFIRFLQIARGSSYELETQIIICADLEYIDKTTASELYKQNTKVQRLLNGLLRALRNSPGNVLKENAEEYGSSKEAFPFEF